MDLADYVASEARAEEVAKNMMRDAMARDLECRFNELMEQLLASETTQNYLKERAEKRWNAAYAVIADICGEISKPFAVSVSQAALGSFVRGDEAV